MSDTAETPNAAAGHGDDVNRRDFLYVATAGFGAVGGAMALWPLIDQMNPAADTLALATIEVDVSSLTPGQAITVKWRGKPVFIRYRTEDEIAEASNAEVTALRDPQSDEERFGANPNYAVMLGVCTHLGCVPQGQKASEVKGDFNGWFCPCHGSHYDTSGRIRKGPAPKNLEVPQYAFLNETRIQLG